MEVKGIWVYENGNGRAMYIYCPLCETNGDYCAEYDSYFCRTDNLWLEKGSQNPDSLKFGRPETPREVSGLYILEDMIDFE